MQDLDTHLCLTGAVLAIPWHAWFSFFVVVTVCKQTQQLLVLYILLTET